LDDVELQQLMNFEGNIFGVIIAALMVVNTLVTAWNGRKTRATTVAEGVQTRDAVGEVHKVINSQLTAERAARNDQETKLVEATQRAARAEGVLEGTGIATVKKED
jgi:hypothetical protein